MIKKTTMYKQGADWIVSSWSDQYQAYVLSHGMSYAAARAACGRDNARPGRGVVCVDVSVRNRLK